MVPALVRHFTLHATRIEPERVATHTFRVVLRNAHAVTALANLTASAFVAHLANAAAKTQRITGLTLYSLTAPAAQTAILCT